MTLEELQAEIDRLNGELTTVNTNNTKLVKEKRDALSRAESAEASIESANTATLSDLDKANKRAEKAERDLKAANDRADATAKTLRDFRADNAIQAAIAAANVDAKHVPLLVKAFRADTEFDDNNEPVINGKSIDAHSKAFFAKDGLSYVRAANNTGGLATGNDGSDASPLSKKPETADEWNAYMKLSDAERAALDKQHGI